MVFCFPPSASCISVSNYSLCIVGSNYITYPVNLIQVIRLQKGGADNALARSSLHLNGQFAVEEVEVADNGRSISFLVDSELGTIGAGGDTATTDLELVEGTGLGEVKVKVGLGGTLVGRACCLHGVAVRVSLS